jgi:hypothetical protein
MDENKKKNNALDAPFCCVTIWVLGKKTNWENRFLSYNELAEELVAYVADMNFTWVCTNYGISIWLSWGYQQDILRQLSFCIWWILNFSW